LVSTGNRALDDLLGGGQALGTLLMVESDDLSCYGETILKYGIAQALSSGHDVLVMTDYFSSPESVSATLPYNQNIGNGLKLSQSSQSPLSSIGVKPLEASTTSVPSSAGSDETSLQSEAHKESGLKIAWQYEKYMMQGSTMKCLTYPQRYVLLNLTFNFFCYPLSAVSEKDKVKNSALQSSLYCCSYDLSRRYAIDVRLTLAILQGIRWN
jgi:PAXNEB protein